MRDAAFVQLVAATRKRYTNLILPLAESNLQQWGKLEKESKAENRSNGTENLDVSSILTLELIDLKLSRYI